MEHQSYTTRVNDSVGRQPVSWEAMMRRRSSMSAVSLRRCSLLSVSMFDMPTFPGKGDLLLDEHTDLDPFAPLSYDPVGPLGTSVQNHQQQQQQQRLPQQLPSLNQRQQHQMNDFKMPSQVVPAMNNSNYNVILNDRSESSRMSYSSNGNNSLPMIKSLASSMSSNIPTSYETNPSFAASVSPLSCNKASLQIPNKIVSSNNPVPSLAASAAAVSPSNNTNISHNNSEDHDDDDEDSNDNQHRFKPFHEEKWTLRYKELLAFHQEHGHAAVPHTYPRNPQLARWVKRQRRQYKLRRDGRPSTMTTERLEMLSSVGFVWDSHDVNWREKLDSLQTFRKDHGHCNVPSNYVDKKLATWVKCQRRQYKLYWDGKPSAMSPERILELEKVGFEWEIRSTVPRKAAAAAAAAKPVPQQQLSMQQPPPQQQQQQQQPPQQQQEDYSLLYMGRH